MKKWKFTFWLLGLGCGFVIAGLIGTFVTLKIAAGTHEKNMQQLSKQLEEQQTTHLAEAKEQIDAAKSQEAQTQKMEIPKGETPKVETPKTPSQEKVQPKESAVAVEKEQKPVYQEVDIPADYSAAEICDLLEKKGLIDDQKAFLDYIKSLKKQRYIKHGHLKLPVGATYEALLKELLS